MASYKLSGGVQQTPPIIIITHHIHKIYSSVKEFESRSGEVHSKQHYVIKFVSDLRPVCGFLRVFRFSQSIKLKYC